MCFSRVYFETGLIPNSIATYLEPLLRDARGGPASSKHIAVVAHGIFNAEFIGALLARRQGEGPLEWSYKGTIARSLGMRTSRLTVL